MRALGADTIVEMVVDGRDEEACLRKQHHAALWSRRRSRGGCRMHSGARAAGRAGSSAGIEGSHGICGLRVGLACCRHPAHWSTSSWRDGRAATGSASIAGDTPGLFRVETREDKLRGARRRTPR